MNQPEIVQKEEIKVIGIAVQTSNEAEATGAGKIPGLWQRYFEQQIENRIPNQCEANVMMGLYTEYENEIYGSYLVIIGKPVNEVAQLPEGMVAKTIPAGTYAVFTTRKGAIFEVVVEAWQHIWQWFSESEMKRTFTGDYELYDENSIDPHQAEVKIYIAIEPNA